jgi:hypothetical protein
MHLLGHLGSGSRRSGGVQMTKPPKTFRYCLSCRDVTVFRYDKGLGHSECVACGGRFAMNPTRALKMYLELPEMNNPRFPNELDEAISGSCGSIIRKIRKWKDLNIDTAAIVKSYYGGNYEEESAD